MTVRLTGFVLILALLGLSGYAALENARRTSATRAKPPEAAARAELASARVVLAAAASELERMKAVSGTYDNDLSTKEFPQVELSRAEERSYCLEFEQTSRHHRARQLRLTYQIERSSCSTSAGVAGRGFAFAPGR
jgi:hypothetical protein